MSVSCLGIYAGGAEILMRSSMDLSLVIPIYKAADYAAESAQLVHGYLSNIRDISFEIIFVDDGSPDQTSAVLRALNLNHVQVLTLAQNQGKFGAIIAGMLEIKRVPVRLRRSAPSSVRVMNHGLGMLGRISRLRRSWRRRFYNSEQMLRIADQRYWS